MKKRLAPIKDQFQGQIHPGSVDLCTVWKSSLLFVNLYSQGSIDIHHLVNSCIPETIDFYLEMLNFRSEFSLVTNQIV